MADDIRSGLGAPGQRTTENTSGRSANIAEPLEHLRLLLLRRVLEGLYVAAWAPVLVGPWVLALYVPALFAYAAPRIERWFWPGDEPQRVDPGSLLAIGVLVAAVIAFLPAPYRDWWPLRVVWSAWSPRWIWARAVALLLPWVAWRREVPYIDSRQRQEIAVPTLSGVAYSQPAPHLVRLPGVVNPFRDPAAPQPEPDPEPELRRILQRNRGHAVRTYGDPPTVAVGNGAGDGEMLDLDVATTAELVAFPVKLFGRGNAGAHNATTWAARVLADESRYSGRAAVKDKLITDWSSRQLFDWMQRNAYADPPDAMHRRALTGRGRRLLRSVSRGEFSPF